MFLKNMIKSITSSEPALDKSFWQLYRARADFYICKGIKDLSSLKLKIKSSILRFIDNEENPFMYGIVVSDPGTQVEPLMFPLADHMKLLFCFDEDNYAIDYFIRVDDDLTLMFKFKVRNKDFAESGQFKEIVGRLFYQAKHKHPIALCTDENQFLERVIYMPELNNNGSGIKPTKIDPIRLVSKPKKSSEPLRELVNRLKDVPATKHVQSGEWQLQDPQSNTWKTQREEAVLLVHERDAFVWELRVLSLEGDVLSSAQIKQGLLYDIDRKQHLVTWVGMVQGQRRCSRFRFLRTTNDELSYLVPALILQHSQKRTLADIVKKNKNDWEKFYLQPENIKKVDQEKFGRYIDQGADLDIEFAEVTKKVQNLKLEQSISETNPIQNFAQVKNNPLLLVSKKHGLEKFLLDEASNQMAFNGSLPIVKLHDKTTPIQMGRELVLQEGDSKMIFTGHSGKDEVFYADVETGKVVAQYEHPHANDVSRVGGKGAWQGPAEFLVLDPKGVHQYDTRLSKGLARQRVYKTKVDFNRVFAGSAKSFAVGSRNGDIRLFSEVGKSAQNLIPSLLGNSVLDIDVSSNGDFVLATCSQHLLLLPTFQNGASGFFKRFLKSEKPHPRVLRLDPAVVGRVGLGEFEFIRGKFDEKDNAEESLIIGTANDFVVIWILEDVLSGKCVSKKVQKIQGGVVAGQFRRNQDWVIAALKNDLKIQKTKTRRGKF